eukprot:SAG31_NODE_33289_length_345_cov_1.162602_1_plen_45_part_01
MKRPNLSSSVDDNHIVNEHYVCEYLRSINLLCASILSTAEKCQQS